MDPMARSTAYQKMVSLCSNIRNEVRTDIKINNQNILPRYPTFPPPSLECDFLCHSAIKLEG